MLPEEAVILSELLRKSTWERFQLEFPRQYFKSKEAKKLRHAIDSLQIDSKKDALPLTLVQRRAGPDAKHLSTPLPPTASHQCLEEIVLKAGLNEQLQFLERVLDGEGVVTADDVFQFHDWSGRIIHRGALNGSAERIGTVENLSKEKWQGGEFPTFLHGDLDSHFKGGVDRGDVCCLMAPYGHGKSTLLRILSYRAAKAGLRVLMISCEDTKQKMSARYLQIHDNERGRKKSWPHIDVVYQNPLDVHGVQNFLKQGEWDIVILDYYGNLSEAEVIDTTSARRTIRALKQLAVDRNFCLWTAVQSHEQKGWQRRSERSDLYGAKVVGHLCDTFLGVYVNLDTDKITFSVHKRRGPGRSGEDFDAHFNVDTAELYEV